MGRLQIINTHMGLFEFDIRTVVGDYDDAFAYVARIYEDNIESMQDIIPEEQRGFVARGRTFYRTGYVPIIWIPRRPKTSRELATLAHEAIHAVSHLFDWAGMYINHETEEVLAHSVAHVVNRVLEKVK